VWRNPSKSSPRIVELNQIGNFYELQKPAWSASVFMSRWAELEQVADLQ